MASAIFASHDRPDLAMDDAAITNLVPSIGKKNNHRIDTSEARYVDYMSIVLLKSHDIPEDKATPFLYIFRASLLSCMSYAKFLNGRQGRNLDTGEIENLGLTFLPHWIDYNKELLGRRNGSAPPIYPEAG